MKKFLPLFVIIIAGAVLFSPGLEAFGKHSTIQKWKEIKLSDDPLVGEMWYGGQGQVKITPYYDIIEIPLIKGQEVEKTFSVYCDFDDPPSIYPESCTFKLIHINSQGEKKEVSKYCKDRWGKDDNTKYDGYLYITCKFKLTGLQPQIETLRLEVVDHAPAVDDVYYRDIVLKIYEVKLNPDIEIVKPKRGHKYVNDRDTGPSQDGNTYVVGPLTIKAEVPTSWVAPIENVNGEVWVEFFVNGRRIGTDYDYVLQGDKCLYSYRWSGPDKITGFTLKVVAYDSFGNAASDSIYVYGSKGRNLINSNTMRTFHPQIVRNMLKTLLFLKGTDHDLPKLTKDMFLIGYVNRGNPSTTFSSDILLQ